MNYVLIVENELFVALHVQEVLERAGYRSTIVSHGQKALAHLEEHGAPRLIVTDLQMPVMGGVQLAAALKKDERWRDVPVLAMSGALDTLEPAAATMFSGFMHKPFLDAQLEHCMTQATAQGARRAS